MKYLKYIGCLLVMALMSLAPVSAGETQDEPDKIDMKEIILGHLSDGYDWHITTWNGHHISIPLPVIVRGETSGWHCFSSSRLAHGATYEGFYIDSERNGKIYEQLPDGEVVRPYDFSITKNVVQIWITVFLMLTIFIGTARWYRNKRPSDDAPRGFVGLIEMFVMMVNDDVIKPSIGERHYKRFVPYLLTAFFFIFITNLLGILPVFPGGANVTGNISITFFLAFCTLLVVNFSGNKEYWKEILWPDVPLWLKMPIPMMPVIELFGILTKPFALMARLFANIVGGHSIILSLTCVIFITWQINAVMGTSFSLISFVLMIFMDCLELLVAFIQAYVFTMLSAIFIGLALPEEHHNK